MNNETYEQKCLQLDKELAELLGWTNSGYEDEWGDILWQIPNEQAWRSTLWTLNDGEAFRLAVEYEVCVRATSHAVLIIDLAEDHFFLRSRVSIEDFPDKLSAVRWAIVQAVVNKLKE